MRTTDFVLVCLAEYSGKNRVVRTESRNVKPGTATPSTVVEILRVGPQQVIPATGEIGNAVHLLANPTSDNKAIVVRVLIEHVNKTASEAEEIVSKIEAMVRAF